MTPTRWSSPRASFSMVLVALALVAAPAAAQFQEPALRALDLPGSPVSHSPRLLGMGGLSQVIADRDAAIDLWDFVGMPVGLATHDSTSTLDLRPGTGSLSSLRNTSAGVARQDFAARTTRSQIEAVYRNRSTLGFAALVGELTGVQTDRPFSETLERREALRHPQVAPVLGGRVPRLFNGHLLWAAHLRYRFEVVETQFREIVTNGAGQWIGSEGVTVTSPLLFDPTKVAVLANAYGVSTAYRFANSNLGFGIEHETQDITSTNEQYRSEAEYHEERPYWTLRSGWTGRLGRSLEYGFHASRGLSTSEADWRFTASSGIGGDPLAGRGNMLLRDEKSTGSGARLRWTSGRATAAVGVNALSSTVTIDPPKGNDPTSFNRFINLAYNRRGADSLSLPDSIRHLMSRRNVVAWNGGVSYRFGSTRVGVEGAWNRDAHDSNDLGAGPFRVAREVRVGLERPLGVSMTGRLGFAQRTVDEDDYTAGNEYVANSVAAGFGWAPRTARWDLQVGYAIEFRDQDWAAPGDGRQGRQNLAARMHWAF